MFPLFIAIFYWFGLIDRSLFQTCFGLTKFQLEESSRDFGPLEIYGFNAIVSGLGIRKEFVIRRSRSTCLSKKYSFINDGFRVFYTLHKLCISFKCQESCSLYTNGCLFWFSKQYLIWWCIIRTTLLHRIHTICISGSIQLNQLKPF